MLPGYAALDAAAVFFEFRYNSGLTCENMLRA